MDTVYRLLQTIDSDVKYTIYSALYAYYANLSLSSWQWSKKVSIYIHEGSFRTKPCSFHDFVPCPYLGLSPVILAFGLYLLQINIKTCHKVKYETNFHQLVQITIRVKEHWILCNNQLLFLHQLIEQLDIVIVWENVEMSYKTDCIINYR